jgi:hypothetical protein
MQARHWLDYDSVAFAVLVVWMGAIELLATYTVPKSLLSICFLLLVHAPHDEITNRNDQNDGQQLRPHTVEWARLGKCRRNEHGNPWFAELEKFTGCAGCTTQRCGQTQFGQRPSDR